MKDLYHSFLHAFILVCSVYVSVVSCLCLKYFAYIKISSDGSKGDKLEIIKKKVFWKINNFRFKRLFFFLFCYSRLFLFLSLTDPSVGYQQVLVLTRRIGPAVEQFAIILRRPRGRRLTGHRRGIVRVVGRQRRVLAGERQLAGVQVRTEELIGRLEDGARVRELGRRCRRVRSGIEIVGGWVGAEGATARRMVGRLLV